jgi:hypothetical protein
MVFPDPLATTLLHRPGPVTPLLSPLFAPVISSTVVRYQG